MNAPLPRRAILVALAASSVAAIPPPAAPAVAAPLGVPSDLARACDWAIQHSRYINAESPDEEWDDARLNAEVDRYSEVVDRALVEPSRGLDDLRAKARLALHELERELFPFSNPAENAEIEISSGERFALAVLREVIGSEGMA